MEPENHDEPTVVAEREIIIADVRIRIRSVFSDKVKLEDALKNIALKRQRNGSQPKAC